MSETLAPDYKAVASACWRAGCDEQDGPQRIERILASYTEEVVRAVGLRLCNNVREELDYLRLVREMGFIR